MIFGDAGEFAVEAVREPGPELPDRVGHSAAGRVCVWMQGVAVGDFDEPCCVFGPVASVLQRASQRLGQLWDPSFGGLSPDELFDRLDHAVYRAHRGRRLPPDEDGNDESLSRFAFLTNDSEAFDGWKVFLLQPPDEAVMVLVAEPEDPAAVRVLRFPAVALVGAARAFAAWVDAQGDAVDVPSRRLRRAAAAAFAAVAFGAVSLHVLRPDLDPVARHLSEYAVGAHGWIMTLVFAASGLGAGLFARLLARRVPDGPSRFVAVGALTLVAASALGMALFVTDLSVPDERGVLLRTTAGHVHDWLARVHALAWLVALAVLPRTLRHEPVRLRRSLWLVLLAGAALLLRIASPAGAFGLTQRLWVATLLAFAFGHLALLRPGRNARSPAVAVEVAALCWMFTVSMGLSLTSDFLVKAMAGLWLLTAVLVAVVLVFRGMFTSSGRALWRGAAIIVCTILAQAAAGARWQWLVAESKVRGDRIGAALVDYRAARGAWPDRLEALVPAHLPFVPPTAMGVSAPVPFAYRVEDGDFELRFEGPWSDSWCRGADPEWYWTEGF
ncbi:MAG: DUF998 domain-containing protein [Planctomycetota bacterium]